MVDADGRVSVNRRGFISLLAGAAGATLVPWRGSIEPLISLPPRSRNELWFYQKYFTSPYAWYIKTDSFSNRSVSESVLTQESLEAMLIRMRLYTHRVVVCPTQLIVSPQIKHLIDTDPVIRHAAEMALGRRL